MLLGNRNQSAYKQTSVNANTAVSNSFEINFMLHEKLESVVLLLEHSILEKDYESKAKHSQKCIDILIALDTSLDLENPVELIVNIHRLYEHTIACVFKASKEMDVTFLSESKTILSDLKDGWKGLIDKAA